MSSNRDIDAAGLMAAFDAEPFGRSFELRSMQVGEATFASHLAITARHQIDDSFVHGGCIAAVCEQTNRFAAQTVLPRGTLCKTIELHLDYLAGASGQQLWCKASVVAVARHGVVVQAQAFADDEQTRLVASCRSTVLPWEAQAQSMSPQVATKVEAGASVAAVPCAPENEWRQLIKEDFDHGWRRFCGMQPCGAAPGRVELCHVVEPWHVDDRGRLLAGLIAPFADNAGGACAYSTAGANERLATLALSLSYLHQQARGRALRARACAIKVGKTIVVSRVDVFTLMPDIETLVATATVTVTRAPGHARKLPERPQHSAATANEKTLGSHGACA